MRTPPKKWSDEEHKKFLEGLHLYGKSRWKEISGFIKTRTPTQVASHAQKYHLKIARKAQRVRRKNNVIFAGSYLIFFLIFVELRDSAMVNILTHYLSNKKFPQCHRE